MQGRSSLQVQLDSVEQSGPERTTRVVDLVLADAARRRASDVHFDPTNRALDVRYRLDGVLQLVARVNREVAPNLMARLKVLAELLTYRTDIPQEGRLQQGPALYGVDMRISTFPTIHGEKAVVRLFDPSGQVLDLDQLGFSPPVREALIAMLRERSGAILLTGPSGSGKTTTIYACLRYLVQDSGGGRHIITIEDPVEQVLEGISQSQARPGSEFDFARGLRSLLRQDPEVIMVGEVRDPETAGIAIESALTGHLVFTTLHAGSGCGVISRLMDMGIEPYLLTSAVRGILNQRLVRRRCPECELPAPGARDGNGCSACGGTGYRGRLLLAECLQVDESLRRAILARADSAALEAAAARPGRQTIWDAAEEAVAKGSTSSAEIERVLGSDRSGGRSKRETDFASEDA